MSCEFSQQTFHYLGHGDYVLYKDILFFFNLCLLFQLKSAEIAQWAQGSEEKKGRQLNRQTHVH